MTLLNLAWLSYNIESDMICKLGNRCLGK
jgi:hypothetical protein